MATIQAVDKQCRRCGETKPLALFNLDSRHPDGHKAICRDCYNAKRRSSYQVYDESRARRQAWNREYQALNRQTLRDRATAKRRLDRDRVFDHYGRECACCTSTERLTIDHINGDGRQHRMQLFGRKQYGAGFFFYDWLIKNDFPDGYQTLCLSCNISKGDGPACRLDHAGGG